MNYIKRIEAENTDLKARMEATDQGIQDLISYLCSDKFADDSTVQVRDVLKRLEQGAQAGLLGLR